MQALQNLIQGFAFSADINCYLMAALGTFLGIIIGALPGETVMVEVTFPDPYISNPDLAGKDAVFVTTINYIQGEPELPKQDSLPRFAKLKKVLG